MTQAFNLAQLANNLNTSGQLDGTDGLSGLVANANLASSGTANSSTFLRGDRTWSQVATSGRILQAVSNTYGSQTTFTANTWTNVFGVTITPSSTSSRILLCLLANANVNGNSVGMRFTRNGTAIFSNTVETTGTSIAGSSFSSWTAQNMSTTVVDSPSTTSSITYNLQFQPWAVTGYINWTANQGNTFPSGDIRGFCALTALEIGL